VAGLTAVLSRRALNRATLQRQLLLDRVAMPALGAVEHLVGMQAQVPLNPYVALWARLAGFQPQELAQLLLDRKVVRIVVMRATLHLVTADDCLVLRPLAQPVLDAELARHMEYGPLLGGVDLAPVLAFGRGFLADAPRSGNELRAALAERFPDLPEAALAYACRNHLAVVQVPPRGVWGRTGGVRNTTAEAWLGRPLEDCPSVDAVMLRYLGAFGPATVADASTWSRLTGLREVFERLRPRLRTFRDEAGRELFDVPGGPRPGDDVPAPPRFLPEYDNVLLSHADRSRFMSDDRRRQLMGVGRIGRGSLLLDGGLAGHWWTQDERAEGGAVTLVIGSVEPLPDHDAHAVVEEGGRLLRFLHPDAEGYDVRLEALPVSA
jgi:hypothetical protein